MYYFFSMESKPDHDACIRALRKIAEWDASRKNGYLDEWQESAAFHAVQRLAQETLDPEAKARRIAQRNAEVSLNLSRIRALEKNVRYFLPDFPKGGAWVRFLKGDPNRAHDGIVRIQVLERIEGGFNTSMRTGSELEVNVCNLRTGP